MITLAEVKTGLNITDSSLDTVVSFWIPVAEAKVRDYCRRNFTKGDYTEKFDFKFSDFDSLFIKETPINTIAEVKDDDDILDATDYSFDSTSGRILLDEIHFTKGKNKVEVTYNGGYEDADLPKVIKEVLIKLIADLVYNTNNAGIDSEKLGDYSYKRAQGKNMSDLVSGLPMQSELCALLNSYRVHDL